MAQSRKPYIGARPDTRTGSSLGGPKPNGPKPARHIPWPEIFQHHISLIEGHLKMTDMIRKHTTEGSGNWHTICSLIDRTKEMLYAAKTQSKTFVPPFDTRDQVPVGSSSASMYPGYSPANHEYGKAAEKYGNNAAAARDQGIDIKPAHFHYEIGQGRGVKRATLAGVRAAIAARDTGTGSGAGLGLDGHVANSPKPRAINGQNEDSNAESSAASSARDDATPWKGKPLFVNDVNPTPVDLPGMNNKSPKRGAPLTDNDEGKKTKKAKTNHTDDKDETSIPKEAKVEFEDISQEVNARLKAKEEKRKRKEKKRKNDADVVPEAAAPDAAEEPERPKNKKAKLSEDASEEGVEKKKKKRKTSNNAPEEDSETRKRNGPESDEGQGERKKKKRKRNREANSS